jgi:hypothetical protein
MEPVTSEPEDGALDANGLENGLSLKRLDSELHPAANMQRVAAATNRYREGELIGPTRERMCYSRNATKLRRRVKHPASK